jgi:hypothetical protein
MPITTLLFAHVDGRGGPGEGDCSSHKPKGFNYGTIMVAMLGFDLALIVIVGFSTQLCSF